MRDFTIGVVIDRFSNLEELERQSLQKFGTAISQLPGTGFEKDWFIGNQFDQKTLPENIEEIETLIKALGDDLIGVNESFDVFLLRCDKRIKVKVGQFAICKKRLKVKITEGFRLFLHGMSPSISARCAMLHRINPEAC